MELAKKQRSIGYNVRAAESSNASTTTTSVLAQHGRAQILDSNACRSRVLTTNPKQMSVSDISNCPMTRGEMVIVADPKYMQAEKD